MGDRRLVHRCRRARSRFCFAFFLTLALVASAGTALAGADGAASAPDPFAPYPAGDDLARVIRDAAGRDVAGTGVTRRDYLSLVAKDVDFFKSHQDDGGAIIDPYTHREVQYATPAFALAAAALVTDAGRQDLLAPATRAFDHALTALVEHHAADGHADFYIPLLMHAHRRLAPLVDDATRARWRQQLMSIEPTKTYRVDLRDMNWNIVSSVGECMRRKDGLVAPDRADAQWQYLEESLARHLPQFTTFGMYVEHATPLAYDAFSRMWLEDAMADGAYADGKSSKKYDQILRLGGLSSLLLLSPSGEWASGGRSALHNWNEAETAVICEIEAKRWKAAGRADVAGAFKRAARLAFRSMQRWQRPSGELWIVKNHAEPDTRLGFEAYSQHSQYNLLPMAMLVMAYDRADDTIVERPIPSEVGGYVLDLSDDFHKVVAAAGGYYIEIDTAGDPHYTATGLQRVHRAGVAFSPLSDSTSADRAYGPNDATKYAMTPGLQWKDSTDEKAEWRGLADYSLADKNHRTNVASDATLRVLAQSPEAVSFWIDYALIDAGGLPRHLVAQYKVDGNGVGCVERLVGGPNPAALRVRLPVLVSDGADDSKVAAEANHLVVTQHGATLTYEVTQPKESAAPLRLTDPTTVNHNGQVRPAVTELPAGDGEVSWRVTLTNAGQ
jgi:hypothetical protein